MPIAVLLMQAVLMLSIGLDSLLTWLESSVTFPMQPARIAGAILALVGFLFAAWSARVMKSSFTVFAQPRSGARLVTEGPYSRIRNPIYTGVIFWALGCSLFTQNSRTAWMTLTLLAVLSVKVKYEECFLREQYGEEYERYSEGRGIFLPGL